jgi:hypothetical protein
VGEQLSAPLRISVRPVGHCVRGPSPACAIVVFVLGAFTAAPAIRVVREGEGRRSYSLSSASGDHCAAHLSDRRLFSAEDADPPWTFLDLEEPSPNRVDL